MKVKVTIPEYLSIKHYKQLQNIEHLSDFAKFIKTISVITGLSEQEVEMWDASSLAKVYNDVIKCMDSETSFHPIFEYEGVMYGYSDMKRMKLKEYNDLERLSKNPTENLSEIMAILYRPVETHKFKDTDFKIKHNIRLYLKKTDNIFKYYTLEDYDSRDRELRAEVLDNMPVQFALGALSFFLGLGSLFFQITLPYSNRMEKKMKVKAIETNLRALASIGDGLAQFIHSPNQIYSVSQETKVSLI